MLTIDDFDGESTARSLVTAEGEFIAGPVITPWSDRNVRLMGSEGIQLTLFTPDERPG